MTKRSESISETLISSSENAEYFRLFLAGSMLRIPQTGVFLQRGFQKWTDLIYTFALLRLNGEWILVNTGFPDDVTSIRNRFAANIHSEAVLEREGQWKTLAQLETVGIKPHEIAHVILGCLGPYSTGHIQSFPNAKIYLGRTEWIDFHAPSPGAPVPQRDFILPRDTHRWLLYDVADRVYLLEDEDVIVPGLKVFRAGGHHHGSLGLIIHGKDQTYCYSDTFFTYRSITENIPPGWIHSVDDFYRARQRAIRENYHIIPAFDREVFTRHPAGIIIED